MAFLPLRYCGPMKHMNGVLAITDTGSISKMVTNLCCRSYAKDKGSGSSCCKDITQTAGREVQSVPKDSDPCLSETVPNSDPYRIKVHDMVVPPLPPSNAKSAIDCKLCKPPCSAKPTPEPPPCPKPPPPPFPWIYLWLLASFCAVMGLIYKYYLYIQEQEETGESKPVWRPRRVVRRPFHAEDLPPCVQYLIIGTGAAGWSAYQAIKENDKTAKVFLLSREDCLPYKRPPMSKHMWWNEDPPDLKTLEYIENKEAKTMFYAKCKDFMDPVKFYRRPTGPAVSIATGWEVSMLDPDDHVVYVETPKCIQPIYYERCLFAPGSKPKQLNVFKSAPKSIRKKVSSLNTIRDLEGAYRAVKDSKRVAIVGGGVLGCELAWHLGRMNAIDEQREIEKNEKNNNPNKKPFKPIEIVHIYKDKGILGNMLPEYLGEWAAEHIKCEGVKVVPKAQVYDVFETKDCRLELVLSNGNSVVADYVLVAVGNEPRDELAEISFLELDPVNGGYLVNTELEARTHFYIAGDAASLYSQWKDTRYRVEHYDNAAEQGAIAGANMTGFWLACNMEPHFELNLGEELNIQVIGEVGACMPTIAMFKDCSEDDKIQAKKPKKAAAVAAEKPCFKQPKDYHSRYKRGMLFYLRDEIVVGIVVWNIPPIDRVVDVATEILRAKPSYEQVGVLAELLGFDNALCTYPTAEEAKKESTPCITAFKEW